MKKYFKDYGHLCKETGEFYKKHWLGTLLFTVVVTGAEMLWLKKRLENSLDFNESKEGEEA